MASLRGGGRLYAIAGVLLLALLSAAAPVTAEHAVHFTWFGDDSTTCAGTPDVTLEPLSGACVQTAVFNGSTSLRVSCSDGTATFSGYAGSGCAESTLNFTATGPGDGQSCFAVRHARNASLVIGVATALCPADSHRANLWWAGALLSALGSMASNLGVNVQKFSFVKNAAKDVCEQKSYLLQPLWWLGLVLVILGSLGDFAALGLAAQSIVAPIGAITLVSNVLFAHFGLKEPLSKRDIAGTCFIIIGSTVSVAFGNHVESSYTIDQLRAMYIQPGFGAYVFILIAFCVPLYVIIKKMEPTKMEMAAKCAEYAVAIAASPRDSNLIQILDQRIAELERKYQPWEKVHPFCYCALSGCLGAQSILFGKMLAEMISMSVSGDNQMIYPLTYVFLVCMLISIFCQLHFLALGLRFFDALYVVPVFQCFFISVSTLGGAAYFDEFSVFGPVQTALFPIGIVLTLTGVYILSSRDMKNVARETAIPQDEEAGMQRLTVGARSGSDADECDATAGQAIAASVGVTCSPAVTVHHANGDTTIPDMLLQGITTESSAVQIDASARSAMAVPLIVAEDDVTMGRSEGDYAVPESSNGGKYAMMAPTRESTGSGSTPPPVLGKPLSRLAGALSFKDVPPATAPAGSHTPRLATYQSSRPDRSPERSLVRTASMELKGAHSSRPGTGDRAQSRFARRLTAGGTGFMLADPPQTPRLSGQPAVPSQPGTARRGTSGSMTAQALNPKRSTWTAMEDGRMLRGSIMEAGFALLGGQRPE